MPDPARQQALNRRAAPDRAVLEAMAEAFTTYDIERLTALLLADAASEVIGMVYEVGAGGGLGRPARAHRRRPGGAGALVLLLPGDHHRGGRQAGRCRPATRVPVLTHGHGPTANPKAERCNVRAYRTPISSLNPVCSAQSGPASMRRGAKSRETCPVSVELARRGAAAWGATSSMRRRREEGSSKVVR